MRSFRKKRRAGNRPMDAETAAKASAAKQLACCPCLKWARDVNMPIEYVATQSAWDHAISGRIRRGHLGFASCDWHHQAIPGSGWNSAHMRAHFGPSLMDGSKLFRAAYGTDDELIALQNEILETM